MALHTSTSMYSVRAVEITLRGIPVSAKYHLLQRVLRQTPPMLGGLGGVIAAHAPARPMIIRSMYSIVCRRWVAVMAVVLTVCKALQDLDAAMQGSRNYWPHLPKDRDAA